MKASAEVLVAMDAVLDGAKGEKALWALALLATAGALPSPLCPQAVKRSRSSTAREITAVSYSVSRWQIGSFVGGWGSLYCSATQGKVASGECDDERL